MKNAIKTIKSALKEATVKAFGDELQNLELSVNPASNPTFGDFQSNVAMTLSKQLKQPPRAIAEQIVKNLQANDIYETPTIAGAGFINFKLEKSFLESQINAIKNDSDKLQRAGVAKVEKPRKVIVDMSSPNIAKEMHVGHLRSTIIGDSIARTFEFLGHDVIKVNHVGDWGTQFGMLIAELKEKYPSALTESEALDLGDLVDFYKQSKKHFDEDAEFKARAHQEVVSLQSGDANSIKAWKLLCDQSRKAFNEIYKTLDIQNLHERGESFYNDMLAGTVKELEEKGIAVEDQGAKCVFLDGYLNEEGKPLPLIVQKRDGGFNYAATDISAVRHRVDQDKADEIVYVVGAEQALHLQMMRLAAQKAGWLPDTVRTTHVGFGAVLGEDGKKLKTRSGETVRLQDLLDEAVQHAREDLDTRFGEKGRSESPEWKENVSQLIGIGAVKYADLSLNRMTNYHFSFKKMLSLQGNTAPYMMYAYVRVRGISREGGIDFDKLDDKASVLLNEPAELELAKQLLKLDDVLESVVEEFLPNRICEYIFELSQRFNQFYEACPVLNAAEPVRTSRLILCDLTARSIRIGMTLLGIQLPERM
ncbi:MAG: arginine--tRNA ligase [Candidatus Obscuribacterales bacterium]|nr:arginine--tRNA ligase [Candidatus Obscuribacterales bacterium]